MHEPSSRPASAQIEIRDLHAWYGESHVLHGMTLDVRKGEVVTLLGRNGAGKTSTLRSIMGLMPKRRGSVHSAGVELIGAAPERAARSGLAYCPEERGVFASLSVAENLELPPVLATGGWTTEQVYARFPNLRERRHSQGTKLSGGEQQMLAIGRILRTGAAALLLDEPTEGLAPVIVQDIGRLIRELKSGGMTILLVEQNFHFAATVADRHYVVEHGKVVDEFDNRQMADPAAMSRLQAYLGV